MKRIVPEYEGSPMPDPEPTQEAVVVAPKQQSLLPAEMKQAGPLTPQQARAVEVTEALAPAYSRASTLEMTEDEIQAIMAPFPDSFVEIRPHDGLIYIPHIHISDRMNRVFKPGKWALVCRRHWLEGNTMYGEYILLIRGCFVGESIGGHPYQPNNPKTNYSDTLESTAAEALRRIAGKRLSCGSQVWNPDYARKWVDEHAGREMGGKWFKKSGKVAPMPAPKPAPAATAPATPETPEQKKERWLAMCKDAGGGNESYARELFIEMGWIMDNEKIADISIGILPQTRKDAERILAEIRSRAGVADPPPRNEPTPPVTPETREFVVGVLQEVSVKTGTSKKGQPWTLYGLKVQDGWANTFDKKIGEAAQAAKGREVKLFYKTTEKGKDCIALQVDGIEYPNPEVPQ